MIESHRRPASGAASKHVPVRAFSYTTAGFIELESGLEHDLVRVLDRDRSVAWLVPQPMRLSWSLARRGRRRRHTPDLLSVDVEGAVTVWDVKNPAAAVSTEFTKLRHVARAACHARGWHYEVFTGLEPIHRHNLLWLHAYRRRPAWTNAYEESLVASCADGVSLGDLITQEPSDKRLAAVWHLAWSGRLVIDLRQPLTGTTEVSA